jgi:hypothetical protein
MDKTDFIGELGDTRQQLGQHLAALASRFELPLGLGQLPDRPHEGNRRSIRGIAPVVTKQLRLVVPGIHVAQRTGTVDDEELIRLRWEMRRSWSARPSWVDRRAKSLFRQQAISSQQLEQANGTS